MNETSANFAVDIFDTPIGEMTLVVYNNQICALDFTDCNARLMQLLTRRFNVKPTLSPLSNPHGFSDKIRRYFDGELAALASLPTYTGGTVFQKKVWQALCAIPAGHTASYQAVAASIGQPKAVRAVGLANHRNPIALIIPCHRVIGANGKLVGYAGGIEKKAWLLEHERTHYLPSSTAPYKAGTLASA